MQYQKGQTRVVVVPIELDDAIAAVLPEAVVDRKTISGRWCFVAEEFIRRAGGRPVTVFRAAYGDNELSEADGPEEHASCAGEVADADG